MSKSRFEVLIEPEAIQDIQAGIDYYDDVQLGLGLKFEHSVNRLFQVLSRSPFFAIRYEDVHCCPLRNFPYMVHYTLDETANEVVVRAVFHTSLSPVNWKR